MIYRVPEAKIVICVLSYKKKKSDLLFEFNLKTVFSV